MLKGLYNRIDFYNKALDGTWERNKAISNNIANVNTPNYKRKTVNFEEQLKSSIKKSSIRLKTTDERHISSNKPEFSPLVIENKNTSNRIDGNNVNIDNENAELAKNNIMYNALISQISGEFKSIKNVISEGSR